jgi:hypothetical protein
MAASSFNPLREREMSVKEVLLERKEEIILAPSTLKLFPPKCNLVKDGFSRMACSKYFTPSPVSLFPSNPAKKKK